MTLLSAYVLSVISALVLGFFVGMIVGRKG